MTAATTLPRLGSGATAAICSLAAVALLAGTVLGYGRREIFRAEAFTERTIAVIYHDAVPEGIAAALTEKAIESSSPDLVVLRPLIDATISGLNTSGSTDPVLTVAAGSRHRRILSPEAEPLVLDLSDVLVLTRGVVGAVRPGSWYRAKFRGRGSWGGHRSSRPRGAQVHTCGLIATFTEPSSRLAMMR